MCVIKKEWERWGQTEIEKKRSFSSVSTGDKHLPTDFFFFYFRVRGCFCFWVFFEMTLGSEESIGIIQVLSLLLQAEKLHPHFPLKPMTSGLGLPLNAYRSNSKLETKPNNPKGFVFSNFSTAWTTAVFLCKFHLSTARAPGGERSKVLRLEKKPQHRDAAKNQILFCCQQNSAH